MVSLARFLVAISLFALAGASPVQSQPVYPSLHLPGTCVITPLGVAQGTTPMNGASRFAVKYASARRWGEPVMASAWEFPCVSSCACEFMTFANFLVEIIHQIRQRSRWPVLSLLWTLLNIPRIVYPCCYTYQIP
jgi:hypothetical protein